MQTPAGTPPRLNLLGDIPSDPSVREAVRKRTLVMELHPGSPSAIGVVQIATKLTAGR